METSIYVLLNGILIVLGIIGYYVQQIANRLKEIIESDE